MSSVKKAVAIIEEFSSSDKDDVDAAFRYLTDVSEENGLAADDIDDLVNILANGKPSAKISIPIVKILIPETTVSNEALEKIMSWFFTETSNDRLSKAVVREILQWLIGVVYYDLADISIIQKYYYSFLFMLKDNYSMSIIGKLIYLLTKPEDAKRWMVKQLLELQTRYGIKPHITSILSLLKSYRPDVVPEKVPMMSLDCSKSSYIPKLEKAHSRKLSESQKNLSSQTDELKWQIFPADKKSRQLPRLIPSAVSVSFDSSVTVKDKLDPVYEFKRMFDLGNHLLRIAIPAQTMALLANTAGYHVIAFSDAVTKSRFSYKLHYTLKRVFLRELEAYSYLEKQHLLSKLVELQEYIHQGIPVVTQFLFNYLLIWDGAEHLEEVLNLLTWVTNAPIQDWHNFVFRPLRQIFRTSGRYTKVLIIQTMGKIIRNLVALSKREKFFFPTDFENEDHVKTIDDIGKFTGELLVEGLIWNSAEGAREMMTVGLEFYNTCHVSTQAGDLPIMILMPPALVYQCLFSKSPLCLTGLCDLFMKYQTKTVERLYSFGVSADYAKEIAQLHVYMLDAYRCLWDNPQFQPELPSFIFNEQAWEELAIKFKNEYRVNIQKEVSVALPRAFTDGRMSGKKEHIKLAIDKDYPSIVPFINYMESEFMM